ncbi:hypothetical protein HKI87_06g45710 [Chloropicon roscoffensis]|uniref:Uncharacterized protein n=1 Tax=Chloropicon roscoffensis TaxID=1461544 RepID=A0AAX4PAD0_9CHLO
MAARKAGYQILVGAENTVSLREPTEWSTGLWSCCDDCEVCCIGYFIPSILYGKNKERIEGPGNFWPDCCAFALIHYFCSCAASCLSYSSRMSVRKAYNLKAQPCGDCCVHCFCLTCALCQEARELKLRGATPTNPLLRPAVQVVPPPIVVPPPVVVSPAQQQMPGPALGVPAAINLPGSAPQFTGQDKPLKK